MMSTSSIRASFVFKGLYKLKTSHCNYIMQNTAFMSYAF